MGIIIDNSIFQLFPTIFMGNGNFVVFPGLEKIKMNRLKTSASFDLKEGNFKQFCNKNYKF